MNIPGSQQDEVFMNSAHPLETLLCQDKKVKHPILGKFHSEIPNIF